MGNLLIEKPNMKILLSLKELKGGILSEFSNPFRDYHLLVKSADVESEWCSFIIMIKLLFPTSHNHSFQHFYLHCCYILVICMLKHTVQLSLQYLELIVTPTESQLEASF